jgi:glycosyltransferase involved in cell wall biosynthesis
VERSLPSLSVAVPVRNEAANIEPLAPKIAAALACLDRWECIWVDDASTDATRECLRRVAAEDPRHRILIFGEHRGQTAALLEGRSPVPDGVVHGVLDHRQEKGFGLPAAGRCSGDERSGFRAEEVLDRLRSRYSSRT